MEKWTGGRAENQARLGTRRRWHCARVLKSRYIVSTRDAYARHMDRAVQATGGAEAISMQSPTFHGHGEYTVSAFSGKGQRPLQKPTNVAR